MTEHRHEPGGTPSPGPEDLTARSTTPGGHDEHQATAVPGAYEADDEEIERGKAVKPGN
jgi:hypothetical protein